MKNKLVKTISIMLLLGTVGFAIAYNVFEANGKNIFDKKASIFSKQEKNDSTKKESSDKKTSTKKESSDKEKSVAKTTPEEENKKVDRSKTIDSNKVDSIIKSKVPDGVITNLEFKNDSKNPHYEVSVVNKDMKYKFEISSKDGSVKEIKKETLKAK